MDSPCLPSLEADAIQLGHRVVLTKVCGGIKAVACQLIPAYELAQLRFDKPRLLFKEAW